MRSWIPVYCAVLLLVGGCAFFKSIGRTLAVAGGAGTGAVVGSAAGPVGTFAGGAAGGGIVYAAMENSELRSGSLQGSEARDAELDRLRTLLLAANGELSLKEIVINQALTGKEWAIQWMWRIIWITLGVLFFWLHLRNVHNWGKYGYWHGVWVHGLFGGKFGTHAHT